MTTGESLVSRSSGMSKEYFKQYYIDHRDTIRKQHALYYLKNKRKHKRCETCGNVYLKNNMKYHINKFCEKIII